MPPNREQKRLKKTSVTLDPDLYAEFKRLAKENDSDASKEIRKFIKEYVSRMKARSGKKPL